MKAEFKIWSPPTSPSISRPDDGTFWQDRRSPIRQAFENAAAISGASVTASVDRIYQILQNEKDWSDVDWTGYDFETGRNIPSAP